MARKQTSFKATYWKLVADACWAEAGRHLEDDIPSRAKHMELEHKSERARKAARWYERRL